MPPKTRSSPGDLDEEALGGSHAVGQRVDSIESTLAKHGDAIDDLARTTTDTSKKLDDVLSQLKDLMKVRTSSDSDNITVLTDSDSASTRTASASAMTPSTSTHDSASAAVRGAPRNHRARISFADGDGNTQGASADGWSPYARPNLQVKPDDLNTFDGTQEQTELFISDLAALLESEPEPTYRPALEKAIVRALPRTLRGAARLWHSTMDAADRAKLNTLTGKHGWIAQLRANFAATPAVVRQQARQRVWNPDEESVLHYTFAKVALMKVAWPQLADNDCITDVADGLPLDLRQLLRVPLLRNPQITELRDELRTQETYWRERHQRPLVATTGPDDGSKSKGSPGYGTLLQPTPAPAASTFAQRAGTSDTRRSGTFMRSRRGKSIRDDFDAKRLFYGPHPHTGKRTMAYKVPDTDEIMWCNRPCRLCKSDHFDFAHEHCSSATVHAADIEDDYPVTVDDGAYSDPQGF